MVERVAVGVNGRELDPIRTKSIVLERPAEATAGWRAEVSIPPDENSATIPSEAFDNFGQHSKPAFLVIERPVKVRPVPSRLFVLAVGVSSYRKPEYNLQFCHADAQALSEALEGEGRTRVWRRASSSPTWAISTRTWSWPTW